LGAHKEKEGILLEVQNVLQNGSPKATASGNIHFSNRSSPRDKYTKLAKFEEIRADWLY